jgi:hypothetical protein
MFGIPNLLNNLPRAIGFTLLGNLANTLTDLLFPAPNWGVYISGTTTPAFNVSSVAELDIGGESDVSDYPLEDGTFATYNKVRTPNMFAIRMMRDGSQAQRAAFLNWLQVTTGGLDIFDVLCPERSYLNATLKSYRISRTSGSGAAMVIADCIFQEVRQIPAVYSSSTIPNPENQPTASTVRVNAIPDQNVQGFPLPPL